MPAINLRETSYEAIVKKDYYEESDIFKVVDEIEKFLIYNKSELIIAIKNGEVEGKTLDEEVDKYIKTHNLALNNAESYDEILTQVNDYIWGYGPIQRYLDDPIISDVAIKNIRNDTWVKKNGVRERAPVSFLSHEKLREFCYLICIKNGGNLSRINARQVLTDAITLKDFILRIVVCIEPINTKSPSISIRKTPKEKRSLEKLINYDMLDLQQYNYLTRAVAAGCNLFLCGKGASGKTTLFNALIEFLPEEMSKLMIQESDELTSEKGNWIWQHVVVKQGESDVEYTLQELVTNGMLLDLDYIGIGEIKGKEAMDLIDAGYTGHTIGASTHASTSFEAINKTIINMKKSGTDIPRDDLLEILGSVIDIIIFMKDYKVIEITEVKGFNREKNEIEYNPVFNFNVKSRRKGTLEGYWQKLNTSCPKIQEKLNISDFEFLE